MLRHTPTWHEQELAHEAHPSLRPVVNATGVILHTNLGRAPLAEEALAAMIRVGPGYSNLEFDLEDGVRGSRYLHARDLLLRLTGAEDALVVNNAAGALVLALAALAGGKGVAVSRGELVEIGGGFRLPEILAASRARLLEVGTTNRTRAADYREGAPDGALLKVHRSNFRMTGFTEEASLSELVTLGRELGLPVIHDLGSGLLLEPARLGLPPEPRPHDALVAGVDLVLFSGDKLLGGPQAGILLGRADAVAAARRHPLCRALRVDGMTLAALEATLALYLDPVRAVERIPTLRMLAASVEEVRGRAEALVDRLTRGGAGFPMAVAELDGRVGGGTFPEHTVPSAGLRIPDPEGALAARLRAADPPVVGRLDGGSLVLDLRTVLPADEPAVERGLSAAWEGRGR